MLDGVIVLSQNIFALCLKFLGNLEHIFVTTELQQIILFIIASMKRMWNKVFQVFCWDKQTLKHV